MRGEYWVNFAHRTDVVSAILGALHHHGAPRVLNVADGTPTCAADIARWLAVSEGRDESRGVARILEQLNQQAINSSTVDVPITTAMKVPDRTAHQGRVAGSGQA
jgi:nucleoside-diphosphate-sugar epimerase